MKNTSISAIAIIGIATSLTAAPLEFDFKDPKGVNNASFKLDAPLESISGSANGLSGMVTFDTEKPAALKGKIVVESSTLHVGNPMMQGHLQSDKWMDVAKFPQIIFETTSVTNVKTEGTVTTADVTGKLTIKDVTKELTVPVKLTYLKDKLSARFPAKQGDLLVLRSDFTIKRGDFNIMPGQMEDKVSDTITLSLSVAGMACVTGK